MPDVADKPKSTGKQTKSGETGETRGRPPGRKETWTFSCRVDLSIKPQLEELIKRFNKRFLMDTGNNDHVERALRFYLAHEGFMDEAAKPSDGPSPE